jgi:GNAT superfamily N-acetyltransferase
MGEVLSPLYGSQINSFEKVRKNEDRSSFLLVEGEEPCGILIFKNEPQNEFSCLGIKNAVEIKSLFLYNPQRYSGKGYGSILFNHVKNHATSSGAENLIVTVSEQKQDSLKFFGKKGFEQVANMGDKYNTGFDEYLLSLNVANESKSKVRRKRTISNPIS